MQVKPESTPNPTLHTAQQRPKEQIQEESSSEGMVMVRWRDTVPLLLR